MKPADAITQGEAAVQLGVSVHRIPKMVRRGELRSYRSKPSLSRGQVEALADVRRRYRMRPDEAASHLNVDPSTLRRWLDAGIVPGHRTVRGRWWRHPEDV